MKRDVSSSFAAAPAAASFAAAGAVLLLAGLGCGLRWRGRLPY